MTPPKPLERCTWPGIKDPIYTRYHDDEWGVPMTDDRALFEKLVLESFQSGLSWLTILKKREAFREAFCDFDAAAIARFDETDVARLMSNAAIVRNRLKIAAAISNAKAVVELQRQQSLSSFLWGFIQPGPRQNQLQSLSDAVAATPLSSAMAKALKQKGFKFLGPTTMYAFMQSTGMVNDHLITCHRYKPCAKLQRAVTGHTT